jgi:predicted Fe-Mo cluster-binding NifX family protein
VKLAISTKDGLVAEHFGRCPEYTLVELKDNEVVERQVIPNPGHEPGFLPRYLAEHDVDVVVTGGMGPRAQSLFTNIGLETIIGARGRVDDVIEAYVSGSLELGDSACEHEE